MSPALHLAQTTGCSLWQLKCLSSQAKHLKCQKYLQTPVKTPCYFYNKYCIILLLFVMCIWCFRFSIISADTYGTAGRCLYMTSTCNSTGLCSLSGRGRASGCIYFSVFCFQTFRCNGNRNVTEMW